MAPSRTSPDPTSPPFQGLTKEQLETFNRDGYLLIPDALDQDTISSLLAETHSLLENFSLDDHPMTKFSTGESSEHVGDDYFLTSGDKIRFFFEEGSPALPLPCVKQMLTSETGNRRILPLRHPHKTQSESNQQDRPLPARPLAPFRIAALAVNIFPSLPIRHRPLPRLPLPPLSPKHDHMQTARDRRRRPPAPRQHLFIHRSAERGRVLVRAGGCDGREWVPEFSKREP